MCPSARQQYGHRDKVEVRIAIGVVSTTCEESRIGTLAFISASGVNKVSEPNQSIGTMHNAHPLVQRLGPQAFGNDPVRVVQVDTFMSIEAQATNEVPTISVASLTGA